LALTSKYKSEFLANMSHELRTPLNSLLILSDQLSKNIEGNLTAKQTEFAKTIHSSGNDLLMLINDILDLSKIESGTVVVDASELRMDDLQGYVERTFRHVAESKNVDFLIRFDQELPRSMYTDAKRLQQIIKNLLSNAFKFTHHGQVTLTVEPVHGGWNPDNEDLNRAAEVFSFAVTDSGIGIAHDKQQIIFEAFQQADGSTSRKYGGTGLGLAISRELSRLLGGEIRLSSVPGRGSTFTLYLPATYAPRVIRKSLAPETPSLATVNRVAGLLEDSTDGNGRAAVTSLSDVTDMEAAEPEVGELVNEVGDDRDNIRTGDRILLIAENDLGFARFLLDIARERGYKGLVTSLGAAALAMAREYKPDAVSLDIYLPDIDGWRVLDRLKNDVATRHIPVCVISTDDSRERALSSGSIAFVAKPIQSRDVLDILLTNLHDIISRSLKSLLVVEPDQVRRDQILACVGAEDVQITTVADGPAALQMLRERRVDCMVVSPQSWEMTDGLREFTNGGDGLFSRLPVIVYGEEAVQEEEGAWKRVTDVCTVRRVQSPERLLDISAFYLHRNVAKLPDRQRRVLLDLHQSDKDLAGKTVLIVDDDMRNIFALSSVLEEHDMEIISADNGKDAIQILREQPDIDIVLMDIMMPEMDGMETMREIRKVPRLKGVPIVAVTAKAMKGDREKCIEAGAWDYLSKPVDTQQMLSVLRAWLHR
jgi:CheY-like chemotaxis protein